MLFGRDFLSAILAVALSATHAEATIAIGTAGGLNGTFSNIHYLPTV